MAEVTPMVSMRPPCGYARLKHFATWFGSGGERVRAYGVARRSRCLQMPPTSCSARAVSHRSSAVICGLRSTHTCTQRCLGVVSFAPNQEARGSRSHTPVIRVCFSWAGLSRARAGSGISMAARTRWYSPLRCTEIRALTTYISPRIPFKQSTTIHRCGSA